MKKNRLFKIILTSILIALNVILERFMPSFSVWNNNISFGFVTVAFAACYLGIPYAMAVGGLGDLIGALIKPFGPYFVGYTLTNMLVGFILAIFLYKKTTLLRITIATLINKIIVSLIINTFFISILYLDSLDAFWTVFLGRLPFVALMTVVEIIVLFLMFVIKKSNKIDWVKWGDVKIPINKRKIVPCILLSIVTFGIYIIYWKYLLIKNTKAIQNDESSSTGEILCLVLVPFYSIFWWFTRGKIVKNKFTENNYSAFGNEIVYLILEIFGLGIVSMAIMQNDFNSLISESTQIIKTNIGKIGQSIMKKLPN